MKKISLLALTVLLIAGCSSKYSILMKYHDTCDQNNAASSAFVGYVDCMNAEVGADPKVSQGSGTINIMATANQFKQKVLAGTMTSEQARTDFQNKYPRFVFKYGTPDPVAPVAADTTAK